MVRTKSSMGNHNIVSMGKTSKVRAMKSVSSGGCGSSSSSSSSAGSSSTPGKNKYAGGNPIHPRETPVWQKEITCFFQRNNEAQSSDDEPAELQMQETTQGQSSAEI